MKPVMTFDVGDAINFGDRIENGPLIVFWGQTEYIPPASDISPPWPDEPPKMTRRERRKGFRPFKVLIRLQPPSTDEDLDEWGGRVSAALGVPWKPRGPKNPDHRAIYLPAVGNYRDAAEPLGMASLLLQPLQGFEVSALQIEIERWEAA